MSADDILSQPPLSLPTAMKVPYSKILMSTELLHFVRRLSTQILLVVLLIVNVLVCVEYLRWKFKLFSTGLWSGRIINTEVHFSVLSMGENWNSKSTVFCTAKIHHQLEAILMRLPSWHLAVATVPDRKVFRKTAMAPNLFVNIHIGLTLTHQKCSGIKLKNSRKWQDPKKTTDSVDDTGLLHLALSFTRATVSAGLSITSTESMVQKVVIQYMLVKIHLQYEREVEGPKLNAFNLKTSTNWPDLGIPSRICNPATTIGNSQGVIQAAIEVNSMVISVAYTWIMKFCKWTTIIVNGKGVDDLLMELNTQVIEQLGHEEWGSFKLTQLADEAVSAVQVKKAALLIEDCGTRVVGHTWYLTHSATLVFSLLSAATIINGDCEKYGISRLHKYLDCNKFSTSAELISTTASSSIRTDSYIREAITVVCHVVHLPAQIQYHPVINSTSLRTRMFSRTVECYISAWIKGALITLYVNP